MINLYLKFTVLGCFFSEELRRLKEKFHKQISYLGLLSHEISHVFLSNLFGNNFPGWLNEGLCEFVAGNFLNVDKKQKWIINYYNNINRDRYKDIYPLPTSFVRFLICKYGKKKLFEILKKTKKCYNYDSFLEKYKSLTRTSLREDCIEWIGKKE